VRVNDAATGQPTPVRVRFADRDGKYHPPFGRPEQFQGIDHSRGGVQLHQEAFAHIDGTCEIALPPDPITVRIYKGFEYTPVSHNMTLGPGKLALRLSVERWVNFREQGWYSGDTSSFLLMPHAALLEAAAEDLAVVNLLAVETRNESGYRQFFNVVAFSGQRPLLESPGHLLVVNTANEGESLGRLGLLNCHRVVYPLATGGQGWPYDWLLADWCDQCHRKGGLVLWAGFGMKRGTDAEFHDGFGGETLAQLILGKIDAVEMNRLDWMQRLPKDEWYRLLNCGFRVPLAGGSYKSRPREALGGLRTYARLRPNDDFNYKNWIEAVRAGRTFVSNGPLLTLTVNGADPGADIHLPEGTQTVRVRAEARSIVPFERLELVCNGEAIAGTEASGSPCSALLEGDVAVPGSGWLAARCWGATPAFAANADGQHAAAHTSPVYIDVPGQPLAVDPISRALLLERLERLAGWATEKGRFSEDRRKTELLAVVNAAQAELVRRSSASSL
jgi:hypothetical protein